MLLSLQKKEIQKKKKQKKTSKQTNKQTNQQQHQNTQKQQQHIAAPVYVKDGDAIRQLL